ncbi:MAG TPA: ABC transporter permease [Thermoflexia bacterium]|nr:ABC transporter permease [Thermoflexia bacterium]
MIKALQELWGARELIYNLVIRDLKVRYRSSLLGIVWSWLNPLLMMLVFSFVFNVMQNAAIPNYHILVLSAVLPWNYFSGAVMGGIQSIVGNGHLIKKVYFPREVLPIATVLSNLVNYLISLPVLFILAIISGAHLNSWVLLLPVPILIQTIFSLGIVLVLCTLEVFYRDTHMLMDVGILAWFFLTPIFYPMSQFPDQAHLLGFAFNPRRLLFWFNPMASIINTYQDLIYRGTPTALDFLARTAVTSLLVLICGYWFFLRFRGRFGEEV